MYVKTKRKGDNVQKERDNPVYTQSGLHLHFAAYHV